MNKYWTANLIVANILGQRLQGCHVPTIVHPSVQDRASKILMELVFVSICHQANWNKLHEKVVAIACQDWEFFHPRRMAELTSSRFKAAFGDAFDETRIAASERTKLLRSLANKCLGWPHADGAEWLLAPTMVLKGPGGLYPWLDTIEVFSADPLRKKSRILVHQLLRYGLIQVCDVANVAPAIDYHLIRLYIRTGRVRPLTPDVALRLLSGVQMRVEPITDLRRAVEEAMYCTASAAGLRIDELNHIEWQLARSFCVREGPRCAGPALPDKPIDEVVKELSGRQGGSCPLCVICPGARDAQLRKLVEPRSSKPYY